MSRKDRLTVAFLVFVVCVAFSLELYWWIHRGELVERAATEWMAWLFKVYGDADRAYFDHVAPMSVGQEAINIFVSQLLNLWLIVAIVARRRYRHILQLGLSAYLSYSVVLYFAAAHFSDYPDMRYRSAWTFGLFYGANLPWLLGYGYLTWDAIRALRLRLKWTPEVGH
ncbi:MAG: hypothetical protein H6711_17465 [Myxococcales bacterium]|nr:hypothetical protein [Myxococcales bacterium]